ncbi:MAG TPA: HIT family protein [Candidatus Paceibacterota bacterium]
MAEKTIFERIASKEIPARIVYEDEIVVAFLDANPNHKGHTLVAPRNPHADIFALPEEMTGHLFSVAKDAATAVRVATGATGINLVMNNGASAGQDVFHAHVHVIPRRENDGGYLGLHEPYASDAEADEYAEKIRGALEKIRKPRD